MKETLVVMNTVKLFDMKVTVALAKYDKDLKRFNYAPDNMGRSVWRPKEIKRNDNNNKFTRGNKMGEQHAMKNQASGQGSTGSSFVQEGMSYANLLRGNRGDNGHGEKVVYVEGKGSLYPLHCIGRSILGHAKVVMSVSKIRQAIEGEGMSEVGMSYVGGVTFMLTFKDKVTASAYMEQHSHFFGTMFSKYSIWNGEDVPFSRVANLSISGVPFIIRDNNLFDRIGGLFGEVVQQSPFSWQVEDNSVESIKVLTSQMSKIDEAAVIKWNDKSIVIWVLEFYGQWLSKEDGDNMMSASDSDSEMESDSDDSEDLNDLEEGEFKQDLGSDEWNHEDNQGLKLAMEDTPVENETSTGDQGLPVAQETVGLNAGGKEQFVHGEEFFVGG
ncbi:hypothetical protein HanHA300_Chr12g0447801 [Helianthus annuus]|nr:hypothetical protein HanHA300_Chr12g0447801 [Helianthus annuus]KAJ0505690.1 hypothetical protein HanHA89_Chr12g0473311 [Helianthus annuus]KAJ0675359.1 hypothetical protein HanLR1_Chr12g0450251 [Helianthus annuus]